MVIEETEGMAVIDVNSGSSALRMRADPKAALLKVNLQAAQQVRGTRGEEGE